MGDMSVVAGKAAVEGSCVPEAAMVKTAMATSMMAMSKLGQRS